MSLYKSPNQNYLWVIEPLRIQVTGGSRASTIRKQAKKVGLKAASVIQSKSVSHLALSNENGSYDFGQYLARSQVLKNDYGERFIYIELVASVGQALVVVIDGDTVVRDSVINLIDIHDDLEKSIGDFKSSIDELLEVYQGQGYGSLVLHSDRLAASAIDSNWVVHEVPIAFTEGPLKDISVQSCRHVPIEEAIESIKASRPWLLYIVAGIVTLMCIWKLMPEGSSDSTSVPVVNPYESYYATLQQDVINTRPRLLQDYNLAIQFMRLVGWSVISVSHTRSTVSYEVKPSEKGSIEVLKSFAKKLNMDVFVDQRAITVVGRAASEPLYQVAGQIKAYDDDQVYQFISDAIETYLPNAHLEFVRDIPQKDSPGFPWVIKQAKVQFSGLYKEDLATLSAILFGLPVGFGGPPTDPSAAQYVVDGERMTGYIMLSIYGTRK